MRTFLASAIAIAATLALAAPANAGWHTGGAGSAYSRAGALAAGTAPTASVTGRDVTIAWSASGGPVAPAGYLVRRYDAEGIERPVGASCAGTQTGPSCTEEDVEPGKWRYSVTPARDAWRGEEGPPGTPVLVAPPSLALEAGPVNSLPSTLSGSISGFLTGESVSFRLDDPESGPMLSGSIEPAPVPAGGTAGVAVTLPAGTADGVHTVYAIGDRGDIAAASVQVEAACSAPGQQTISASQDSYVDSLLTLVNYGGSTTLDAGPGYLLLGLAQRLALVQFPLPTVPARCSLSAATLRLYATSPGAGRTIEALRIASAWSEGTVTWSNKPGTSGAAATSASLGAAGWQEWDVLGQVSAMYGGGDYGFLVKDSKALLEILPPHQIYQAREGTPDSHDPQLVLSFE